MKEKTLWILRNKKGFFEGIHGKRSKTEYVYFPKFSHKSINSAKIYRSREDARVEKRFLKGAFQENVELVKVTLQET